LAKPVTANCLVASKIRCDLGWLESKLLREQLRFLQINIVDGANLCPATDCTNRRIDTRDQIKLVDEEMSMNPLDSTPERPRDVIDAVEDICGQTGSMAEVNPEYYEAFLALSDVEMEVLARAVLNAQAKEARRLTFAEPAAEAPARLLRFASNTLSVIAIGLARFNDFAQLGLYKRVGPEPEPDVHDALTERITNARPIIQQAVLDFIRRQHDAGPETGSFATRTPPVSTSEHGWQTTCDPEVESARIWQLQLSLFPVTPREFCGRMGLNWLAACQLHADGWLSFEAQRRTVGLG
jgi:hypothetical protein